MNFVNSEDRQSCEKSFGDYIDSSVEITKNEGAPKVANLYVRSERTIENNSIGSQDNSMVVLKNKTPKSIDAKTEHQNLRLSNLVKNFDSACKTS